MFCEKVVLRNFTKFTGKHLCQSLFFNKVANLRPATLLKERLWHRCFPVNFWKFRRIPFLQNTLVAASESSRAEESTATASQCGHRAKYKNVFKFGKNFVLCGNHFRWGSATWIKMRVQHRRFPVTKAVACWCSSKFSKTHRKKPVMESFLINCHQPGALLKSIYWRRFFHVIYGKTAGNCFFYEFSVILLKNHVEHLQTVASDQTKREKVRKDFNFIYK